MNTTGPLIILTPEQLQSLVESALRTVLSEKLLSTPTKAKDAPLTPVQAAAYLNVSLSTLYRYTSQRLVPHHKPGKILYFFGEELDAWLLEHRKLTKSQIEQAEVFLPNKGKAGRVVPEKRHRYNASH